MRRLFSGLMIVFCVVGWISLFSGEIQEKKEQETTLQKAYEYAERGLPYYSAQYFTKALKENKDRDLYKAYLVQLYSLNSNGIYYDTLKIYLEKFPDDAEAYHILLKRYDELGAEDEYFALYNTAKENNVVTEEETKRYKEMFYRVIKISGALDEARSFLGDYAAIKRGDKWGLLGKDGQTAVPVDYDSIDVMLEDQYPVSKDGEAYFLGNNGEKKITTNKKVEWLSLMSDGVCVARVGQKYALCDSVINVPDQFEYDYLSISSSGVLAAKKGEKWAIIKNTGEALTDYIYDDIIIDPDRGCCLRNGIIFAKQNGKYIMLDAAGNRVGTESFDDAKLFASTQPAAVKQGDKWGFVNADGTLNGSVKYDEVGSFSLGLYPAINEEGKWGYKDVSGEYVIEPKYDECRSFTSNCRALVKDGDTWAFITVRGYER